MFLNLKSIKISFRESCSYDVQKALLNTYMYVSIRFNPRIAPWTHILNLREKAMEVREECDGLRTRMDKLTETNGHVS